MCMSVCACTCTNLCMYMHKFVHVHAHFNFALLRKFYGVFSTYKNKSFFKTCRHMPLSAAAKLPPPPRRRQAAADLALSRCRHRRCRRRRAAVCWLVVALSSRYRHRLTAAKLPPTSRCRAAATAAAAAAVCWLVVELLSAVRFRRHRKKKCPVWYGSMYPTEIPTPGLSEMCVSK